jgi:ComEC/Rec2-related protein
MLSVAMVYALGVVLGWRIPLPAGWLLLAGLAFALLALRGSRWQTWWLAACLVLAGWANLVCRTAVIAGEDLRVLLEGGPALIELRGRLLETPVQRLGVRRGEEVLRSMARVRVAAIKRGSEWEAAVGEVMATAPFSLGAEYVRGRDIRLTGVARVPASAAAPGVFDYRAYLYWQGVYYLLETETSRDWQLARERGVGLASAPLADRFQTWARGMLELGLPAREPELDLLWAMTLGWKTGMTAEVSEPFMRSGTMHVFAISGLHIALITGILVQLLRLVQVPRGGCGLIVLPLIWFYTAATGWQASAVRSTLMMSVVIGGWALRRPGDLMNSLMLAAWIILVLDPRQLFQAGFQLSFFVVLSLAVLIPPMERWQEMQLRAEPLQPEGLRPRWWRVLRRPLRGVTTALATSLAAWAGSLPLIAHYFHLVTPVSLLANLVIVPLSSLALMCNLGALCCGGWWPDAAVLFNHSAWLWMRAMLEISRWSVTLPGAFFYVPGPGPATLVAYYGVLVLLLLERVPWRGRVAGASIVAAAGMGVGLVGWWRCRSDVQITVLPERGGHAIFVDAPGWAGDVLVDAGDEGAAMRVIKPFLEGQGVNRLERVVLTHEDARHHGGAALIVREFRVRHVVAGSIRQRGPVLSGLSKSLRAQAPIWRIGSRGDEISGWRVLHPGGVDRFSRADDAALVLTGAPAGVAMLLASDLGREGQRALTAREPRLAAQIIIAGVPSRDVPIGLETEAGLGAEVLVLSGGDGGGGRVVSRELRSRASGFGGRVIFASETGAVTIRVRRGRWELRTMSGLRLNGPR